MSAAVFKTPNDNAAETGGIAKIQFP